MAHTREKTHEIGRDVAALWFIRLEDAVRAGSRRQERIALRELERLGVRVEVAADAAWVPRGSEPEKAEEASQ